MKEDSALVFVAETKGLMESPVIRKNTPSLTERKMVGLRERDDQDKDQDRGLHSRCFPAGTVGPGQISCAAGLHS